MVQRRLAVLAYDIYLTVSFFWAMSVWKLSRRSRTIPHHASEHEKLADGRKKEHLSRKNALFFSLILRSISFGARKGV